MTTNVISSREESTTVGWVPIADHLSSDIELTTIQPETSTSSTSTMYSTTSYADAQIQYRPLKARTDDVPMPMVDIKLPFSNNSHIVTWLDPQKMRPKSRQVFHVQLEKKILFINIKLSRFKITKCYIAAS